MCFITEESKNQNIVIAFLRFPTQDGNYVNCPYWKIRNISAAINLCGFAAVYYAYVTRKENQCI